MIEIVALGCLLGLLMGVTIHVRWGSPIALGLAVLIASADALSVGKFAVVGGVGLVVFGGSLLYRRVGHRLVATASYVFRFAAALGVSAIWAAAHVSRTTPRLTVSQTAQALSIATAVFVVDALIQRLEKHRLDRQVLMRMLSAHTAVLMGALLLALAYRARDLNVAVIPLIVGAVMWRGSKTVKTNQQTVAEATATIGTFPELTKFSPIGHSRRTAILVRAMAETAEYGSSRMDYLVRGATVARIGYIAYPDVDSINEGYAIPTRAELAEHAEEILQETGFLADLIPLVRGFLLNDKATLTFDQAILRVAANFDDFTAHLDEEISQEQFIEFALARLRELATCRAENDAIKLLKDTFLRNPELFASMREEGKTDDDMVEKIESRMAGRG